MSKFLTYTVSLYLLLWWAGLIFIDNYLLVNLVFLTISIVTALISLIYFKSAHNEVED